jgi:hypothetical protein
MSLHKAIASGKEHRVEYGTKGQPYAKSVDVHCRNHGGRRHQWECVWCKNNRTYKNKERERLTKEEIKKNNF